MLVMRVPACQDEVTHLCAATAIADERKKLLVSLPPNPPPKRGMESAKNDDERLI